MHDRAVRRRRAALAALVALSLILLTAYFGESSGGGLHAVQRGAMEVLAPIQEGANRALKPFRDLFGWFGDTMDAKEERDKLRAERDALRRQVAELSVANSDARQQQGLRAQNTSGGLDQYQPVQARVYQRSPSSWYQTALINKGASDGVRVDQPVVGPGGLVGVVERVTSGTATVSLITDHTTNVSARVNTRAAPTGVVSVAAGNPNDLVLSQLDRDDRVDEGDVVVTRALTGS